MSQRSDNDALWNLLWEIGVPLALIIGLGFVAGRSGRASNPHPILPTPPQGRSYRVVAYHPRRGGRADSSRASIVWYRGQCYLFEGIGPEIGDTLAQFERDGTLATVFAAPADPTQPLPRWAPRPVPCGARLA